MNAWVMTPRVQALQRGPGGVPRGVATETRARESWTLASMVRARETRLSRARAFGVILWRRRRRESERGLTNGAF